VGVEVNNGGALPHPYHKDTFSFPLLLSLLILVNKIGCVALFVPMFDVGKSF
jgi:hypothetical protein